MNITKGYQRNRENKESSGKLGKRVKIRSLRKRPPASSYTFDIFQFLAKYSQEIRIENFLKYYENA